MKKPICITLTTILIAGCASITNDSHVPVALSFSDGSSGFCDLTNKREHISKAEIPGTHMVRRSDDNLILDCTTNDGRKTKAAVPSKMGAKIIASAVFIDFGITDAITDKHREYPASFVIPIRD